MDISDSTNLQTLFSRTSSLISLFDLINLFILASHLPDVDMSNFSNVTGLRYRAKLMLGRAQHGEVHVSPTNGL
ncbi:hypothetical protein CGGC5_v003603 [Colletotrichum fructicola Nara gc5]|uniref:Uncharacterized protein n=1 Tax=Colletotrichum fructicola (strain Nara gc5) TaxID=1213859 RepID=A0A7J6JHI3_COLFN|nr:hypothetical protein CFRS1_v002104 [Colletotrichum fructicola]KAF4489450.1 hypothetical protein CGGC5_v003603 [Colletotrichum fructicola Nara gc5]KAF5503340.1 hypothetical protein CGCF413_v005156 [Colletotrichum fructicola]